MMWRLFCTLLFGYLLFVAYRFYMHSQPVTAIDLRQYHMVQTDKLDLAVVWPEGDDKAGYVKAVKLVVEAMNAEGLGRCQILDQDTLALVGNQECKTKTLKLNIYAEPADRKAAVKQAKKIAGNLNTLAVLGYYRSDAAIPAAAVYEYKGVLMLSSGSTNVKLTQYDFKHIFRNAANDDSNAEILAKYIHDQGYINVYVIYERDLYGTDFSNYFIEHAIAIGLRVPTHTFYEENTKDFLPVLSSLRSKIRPINLTDEIALLQAKLQRAKRILQIAQLSATGDDASIIQFLTFEQKQKNGNNRFFDSMPRVKLLQYLQQELEQSSSTAYLEALFHSHQKELSSLAREEQYVKLEQVDAELQMWIDRVKSVQAHSISPTSAPPLLANERLTIRKVIDLDAGDVLLKLEQMQKRVSKIKSGKVDAIFIAGFTPEVALAISQARGLNIDLPIFGGHPLIELKNHCKTQNNCASYGDVYALETHDVNEYRMAYNATLQGVVPTEVCAEGEENCLPERYACPHFKTAYTRFQGFATAYQQRYGIEPDNWAIQGYLAASMIQETLRASHTFEPEVIADTLLYKGNSEFADKGLMFSCNSHGITEGDILVEEMKIHRLGDLLKGS
ncbi:ABC transporter substrate-binding protein [Rheinheimera soli]|uniref:ABC-type branched-subunit amino acid transport system substrate-binding protein n=1 Tax=Rheinheimera soli TaxID=443616 RepID=A0ABU1VVF4_9GAMM|nr:ABC transporter substrate-binding protein [Rheinheimera soli]MDR7119699.1 ABC-type branched-subunit amino acid transport system substrate-binding protein [Rheinheimera soli]